jgi:glycolate oxidase iron-sulfur subunit
MPAAAVPDAFSPARLVALADQCVQCGLCLPHCPTYRLDACEGESPRGRIAYMRALAAGQIEPTPAGDLHLDHCLGCLRCEQVCPAEVRYGALLLGGRALQAARQPRRPLRRLRLAMLARPRLLGTLLALYRQVFGWLPLAWRPLPLPPALRPIPPPSTSPADAAIFVGCIARTYESPARAALQQLARRAGLSVEIPPAQGCCGTAAMHAGEADQAGVLASANAAAFAGRQSVLCLASGCRDGLAEGLAPGAVHDPLVWLETHADRIAFRAAGPGRIALHLPCSQRSDPQAIVALRRWLDRVPGLDWIELPDTGCCGAAGLHQVEHPDRAAALRTSLLDAYARTGATTLLSANIGCRLHLGAAGIPVRHPLEWLAEHLDAT